MTFKVRLYRCHQCSQQVKTLAWDTDPPPSCPTHDQPMHEDYGTVETHGIIDDTIIGGRWCETLGDQPFYYDSKSALRKEAARRGLTNVVRHEESYYARQRKFHDQELRDTGTNREY